MIHTFELSKEISKETFEQMIHNPQYGLRWDKSSFTTMQFADKGLTMVRLRKESDKSNKNFKHYMVYISVNTGAMHKGGDPHTSNNINTFTPDFAESIYKEIYEAIPCLEEYPEVRVAMQVEEEKLKTGQGIHYEKWKRLNKVWLEHNTFHVRRIDYTIDIFYYPHEFEKLLKSGYQIKHRDYCRINIYNKAQELQDKGLPFDPNTNYDFLRIEIQANKGKLESLLKKMEDGGIPICAESQCRELHYLTFPKVEEDVLKYYVDDITGTGAYVPKDVAMGVIDNSCFSEDKKEKLKNVIEQVDTHGGIAKLLQLVRNGTIVELGRPRTVEQYLRDIQALGINPVTLSDDMDAPEFTLKISDDGTVSTTKLLPNLLDIIKDYCKRTQEEHQNGVTLTEEDIKNILGD